VLIGYASRKRGAPAASSELGPSWPPSPPPTVASALLRVASLPPPRSPPSWSRSPPPDQRVRFELHGRASTAAAIGKALHRARPGAEIQRALISSYKRLQVPSRRGGAAGITSAARTSSASALARSWSPARTASASTVARLATACVRSCPRGSRSDLGSPSVTGGSSRTDAAIFPPSIPTTPTNETCSSHERLASSRTRAMASDGTISTPRATRSYAAAEVAPPAARIRSRDALDSPATGGRLASLPDRSDPMRTRYAPRRTFTIGLPPSPNCSALPRPG